MAKFPERVKFKLWILCEEWKVVVFQHEGMGGSATGIIYLAMS